MGTASPMSAEQFVSLPEPDHGRPWNLVAGEVVVNSASSDHQEAADTILVALRLWTQAEPGRGRAGSEIDVGLDERNVYAPDVRWYATGRAPAPGAAAPYPMPDLAVEVRSPSTWHYDVGAKKSGYQRHGLPELWLVDTAARSVLIYRRSDESAKEFDVALELTEGEILTSPLLVGFELPVSDIFELG